MTEDVHWLVGIDWASQKHQVCLLDLDGRVVGEREFDHEGTGLSQLCNWLIEQTKALPGQIAVAIETSHGPIVEMLLERGFQVYSINPKQLDRFRDRFTVAGAKDDSRDAHVLADALRTDRRAFRRLSVENPLLIELREWSRMLEDLKQERNRLSNRMRAQLWRYYPQALEIADDLAANWFLDLWQQVPTPAKAARVKQATIETVLKANRIRRFDAAEVLRVLRQKPLWVAPGTTEAACAHIRTMAARIRLVNQQIAEANRQLDELCDKLEAEADNAPGQKCEQRDVTILRSCPGLGRINIATLLAEAPEPLRRRDYHACEPCAGQLRSPAAAASSISSFDDLHATNGCRMPSIIGLAWLLSMIQSASAATPRCAAEDTVMAHCAVSLIACFLSCVRCCSSKCSSIHTMPVRKWPLHDWPFLCSTETAIPSSRPADRQSAARRRCPGCPLAGTGAAGAKRPGQGRARR